MCVRLYVLHCVCLSCAHLARSKYQADSYFGPILSLICLSGSVCGLFSCVHLWIYPDGGVWHRLVFLFGLLEEILGNSEQVSGSVWFIHLWQHQEDRRQNRRRLTWLFLIWSRRFLFCWLFRLCLSSLYSLLTGGQRRCSPQPPTLPTACADCPSALQFTSATLSLCLSPCPSPLALGNRDPRCLHLTEPLHLTSTSHPGGLRFTVRHAITPAGWSWWVSSLFPQLETFYLMIFLTVISLLGLGSFYSLLQPLIPNQGNDVVTAPSDWCCDVNRFHGSFVSHKSICMLTVMHSLIK